MPRFDTSEKSVSVAFLVALVAATLYLTHSYASDDNGLPVGPVAALGFALSVLLTIPIAAIITAPSKLENQFAPTRILLLVAVSVLGNMILWLLIWVIRLRS